MERLALAPADAAALARVIGSNKSLVTVNNHRFCMLMFVVLLDFGSQPPTWD